MAVNIIHGDCRTVLPTLADCSVQCCVTSPPYYGLRDYGVDGQIGLEPTPDEYVAEMVAVFREVRRVLRDDGVLWLNIGDSYNAHPGQRKATDAAGAKQQSNNGSVGAPSRSVEGLKPKDLLGIPWLLAFALRADGWFLRSDIIWAKPNPMPESVKDRPTSAHEHVFLLSKRGAYFYDADAIAEHRHTDDLEFERRYAETPCQHYSKNSGRNDGSTHMTAGFVSGKTTRNARNVWTIATQPFSGAHFATMPPDLAERCIKAGTSEKGACPCCGSPWVRSVERVDQGYDGSKYGERAVAAAGGAKTGGTARSTLGSSNGALVGKSVTRGWQPSCKCTSECLVCEGGGLGPVAYAPNAPGGLAETCCEACQGKGSVIPAPVPCMVLDPFGGAGTTGLVADRLNRNATLIELNPEYRTLAVDRLRDDAPLLADIA